jgi:competence protein ComEA
MRAYTGRQLKSVLVLLPLMAVWILGSRLPGGVPDEQAFRPPAGFVYEVRGAVTRPGIVSFDMPRSPRDLLQVCGGRIDLPGTGVDFDRPLVSGTRVVVGQDVQLEIMDAAARLLFFLPLSVNSAEADDFALIPGIGPRTAQALVAFRARHGEICDLDELLQVRGIGPRKLEAMRPYLSVP